MNETAHINLLKFINSVLSDDQGISVESYINLTAFTAAYGDPEWDTLMKQVDATDDRFYLPTDTES